jgi:E1-E2 ATPase/Cation transport ATPase (P-type)/Cation transporter/ATPase, N-terminus
VGVAILLPLMGPFTRMIERLVPERGLAFTKSLDPASLGAPTVAVEAVRRTVERVLEALCSSVAVGLENAVEGGTARATVADTMVRQASDALQQAGVFLSNVADLPPFQEGHQWFTITLHALDHAGRLTEAVDEIAKTSLATGGPEEMRAAKLCATSMGGAAAIAAHLAGSVGLPSHAADDELLRPGTAAAPGAIAMDTAKSFQDPIGDAVERLKRCSEQLADLRVTHRRATLDSVASGTLTASAAIARVDAVGLLDRLARHAWRAASHLEGAIASRIDTAVNAAAPSEAPAWHSLSTEEVVQRLGSSVTAGLDDAEASSRRVAKHGPNRLPSARKRGPLMRFLLQFNNILVYVLLAAGFIKLMMGLWIDASIILGVVVINGLLGFIQEGKAEKSLDSIRNLLSAEARTLRDGQSRLIPAEQLAPGDIVFLESGDKIPADVRLVDVKNLRTEEAALTGESVPSDKSTAAVSAKATVGDRVGMAYSGTLVVSGRATGIVVATGSETELGRINQLLAGVSALETPLLLQIKKFGYAITAIVLVVGALTFAYGRFVEGIPFVEIFQAVTGIAVSMIPEGLPALITITLAIGVQRMASRDAIVRRLPAVETLGSVARICSDKTGTLTLMEMMVVSAVTAGATHQITGEGYDSEGKVLRNGAPVGEDPVLRLLGRVSALCNDAQPRCEDGVWKVEGDPTEGALYPFAAKIGLDRQKEQAAYPRIDVIPFESEHRFMATLHTAADGGQVLLVKGAPEVIMDHCDRQEDKTGQHPPIERVTFPRFGGHH